MSRLSDWREHRRFNAVVNNDVKLMRETLRVIAETDPVLARTIGLRMMARVNQPTETWDDFVQKRSDVMAIMSEGLEYLIAESGKEPTA